MPRDAGPYICTRNRCRSPVTKMGGWGGFGDGIITFLAPRGLRSVEGTESRNRSLPSSTCMSFPHRSSEVLG